MGFVDLHAHVLPGVDDGAPDLATSLAMLRGLRDLGFDRVTATPHQKASQFLPSLETIHRAYQEVRAAGPPVELGLAAENYWDEVFFARGNDGTLPRYDDGRAFLFEFSPNDLPARLEDVLFRLTSRGFLPVLAHPERYAGFWNDLDRLERLGRFCALVVDLAALAGHHGAPLKRVARRLLERRLAHAAASDVHTLADVRAAAEGIAWIERRLGPSEVERLLDQNPRRILAGELPDS